MSAEANRIVQKLWSYCTVLRDDGLSYGDYLEQLSVLLFLKLAHEQTLPPWNQESPVPEGYDWSTLVGKDGAALESQYRLILEHLGKQHGLLGLVFRKAQNKIQDPAKLKRLVSDLLDKEQWMTLSADIKGEAYEGLLERNAQDTKSGAGQYFSAMNLLLHNVGHIPAQLENIAGMPNPLVPGITNWDLVNISIAFALRSYERC